MTDTINGTAAPARYQIGEWLIDPKGCAIARNGTTTRISPRSMSVLVYLAQRPGEAVTHDELLDAFWRGAVSSRNAVHKCVTELRHAFAGGDAQTTCIETIARRGYRLVAPVDAIPDVLQGEKTIAVLRFHSSGTDSHHDYLAEGIAAALLQALSDVPGLVVIDRERSFEHSVGNETVQSIGRALDVSHLLSGEVMFMDDRLRISVVLYNRKGEPLYDYRDETPIAKLLHIQDKVVASVLMALEIYLDPVRAADIQRWGTHNVDAYLAALEGDAFIQRLDQKSIAYAATRFRAAIALDPEFKAAYSSLAGTLQTLHLYTPGVELRRPLLEEVRQLHEKLVRLGADADLLSSFTRAELMMSAKSWSDVEALARSAIRDEGAPHRAFGGYIEYAQLLKTGHLFREAGQYLDLYEKYGKADPWLYLRRPELLAFTVGPRRAVPMIKKALTMFQNDVGSLTALVAHLALLGEYQEAEDYLARLTENDQTGLWAHFARLQLGTLRGDFPIGSDELRRVLDDPKTNFYMRGIIYFMLGDVEAGLDAWRAGSGTNDIVFRFAVHNETYYPSAVVNHPGYQEILDRGGIGRRWTAYLQEKVAELAPITGIELGDTTPQRVFLSR